MPNFCAWWWGRIFHKGQPDDMVMGTNAEQWIQPIKPSSTPSIPQIFDSSNHLGSHQCLGVLELGSLVQRLSPFQRPIWKSLGKRDGRIGRLTSDQWRPQSFHLEHSGGLRILQQCFETSSLAKQISLPWVRLPEACLQGQKMPRG